jgi:hypothetical protein
MRQDNSVRIAMGYELEGWNSILGGVKYFSPIHSVQTGSGFHPASYSLGIAGTFSLGVKRREGEADHSSLS